MELVQTMETLETVLCTQEPKVASAGTTFSDSVVIQSQSYVEKLQLCRRLFVGKHTRRWSMGNLRDRTDLCLNLTNRQRQLTIEINKP